MAGTPSPTSAPPATPPPGVAARTRGPRWRWLVLVLAIALLLAGGVAAGGILLLHRDAVRAAARPRPVETPAFTVTLLDVAPASAIPTAPAAPPPAGSGPDDPRAKWIAQVSAHTDIPRRALLAYVRAEEISTAQRPACHLSWTTLAGVGWVESRHGQFHGDSIGPDGREVRPIAGPALDGSPGVQRIQDTDHGTLDGDPVWDHAVGPMQFLPSRWLALGQRASADGQAPDPQNIDDAALTAARYLCDSGGDLASPTGWWAAAYAYNNSTLYGRQVFSGATAYAKASLATG